MDFPLCPKTVRNKIQPRTVVFFFPKNFLEYEFVVASLVSVQKIFPNAS